MGILKQFKNIFSHQEGCVNKLPLPPQKILVNRAPRVSILPLHNISFHLRDTDYQVTLGNISSSGVGFLKDSQNKWPKIGSKLRGIFPFAEKELPITMEVVHGSSSIIGCRFDPSISGFMRSLVLRKFDLELTALRLKKISGQFLKKTASGTPHWLHGTDDCELYFIEEKGIISSFKLSFHDYIIEGGDLIPCTFSRIIDNHLYGVDSVKLKESNLVMAVPKIPLDVKNTTLKFLANIQNIAESHRVQLTERIRRI